MRYFLQGLTVGLAYVAPIGMQNMFLINSADADSRGRTLITAFIVAFFDISLALTCFFGVGAVMERVKWLQMIILLAGSIVVIYIGVGLIKAKGEKVNGGEDKMPLRKTISTACAVTWLNPQAVIDGTMLLGAFRVSLPKERLTDFILGSSSASVLWFVGLAMIVSALKGKLSQSLLRKINIICGVIIIFYGVKLFINFIGMFI